MLELGESEQKIALAAMRAGQPLPDRIANAPELQLGLSLYLTAFFDLDSERSHSQGVTMIPLSRVRSYAEDYEFDAEQTEDLIFFIREMDTAHCKRVGEKQAAAAKGNQ